MLMFLSQPLQRTKIQLAQGWFGERLDYQLTTGLTIQHEIPQDSLSPVKSV